MTPLFDVFLSHNSKDKPAVREIAKALRARKLRVWLDEDELVPGRPWQEALEEIIQTTKAAAVLVGRDGLGPWEVPEMRACLSEFVNRKLPVIPVLLPDAPIKPDLPLFLKAFTWVNLRNGITDEGLDRLVWGITAKKPRKKKAGPSPFLHNLPYLPLGKLLKGRDEELRQLAENLEAGGQTAIVQQQALYGLGGIGKTRLAVEHAWAFGSRYRAAFFVRADTPEGLRTGLAALARADLLNLEQRAAEEETVHEVLSWLKANSGWLLILDNVDSKEAESAVLTLLPGLTGGRVLITSRRRGWPPSVHTQPLDTIPLPEARDFLLTRTNGHRRAAPDDADRARDLAEKLDGLPLALEQAAAYIVHTRLSFSKYLEVWEEERKRVLEWHDETAMGYPGSVATTWQTSFERLRTVAATLLRLCAFLAPNPIPEEMFESEKEHVKGACGLLRSETGQEDGTDSIHEALAELESYSLISRKEATFAVHRVVQEVLQSRIPPERLEDWIEVALRIVIGYAPFGADDVRTWPVWNVLRPHAMALLRRAEEFDVKSSTAAYLASQVAVLLWAKGLYVEAEPLINRAILIDETSLGPDHPTVAIRLSILALLLNATNRFSEAEPLMRRALVIDEATLGSEHPKVAIRLNNLATLLHDTNRLAEAEPLMRRAMAIDEAAFGSEHPRMAVQLTNLATLLHNTNRLAEAELLMRRALALDVDSFGSEHPRVAAQLNNLATLLHNTGRPAEAEPQMRRALAIDEASFGSDHPNVARDLNNLARLLQDTNRLSEAKPMMRRALEIFERSLGLEHPKTKLAQRNLAGLLAEIASQSPPPPASA